MGGTEPTAVAPSRSSPRPTSTRGPRGVPVSARTRGRPTGARSRGAATSTDSAVSSLERSTAGESRASSPRRGTRVSGGRPPASSRCERVRARRRRSSSPTRRRATAGRSHAARSAASRRAGLVEPEPVTWKSGRATVHGLLYRPAESALGAGNAPPLYVHIHGGPTDQLKADWNPRIAFWVSRGWAVLAPNYRGSSGYGRDVRAGSARAVGDRRRGRHRGRHPPRESGRSGAIPSASRSSAAARAA